MIDKTDDFWASSTADDIDEYLKAYSDRGTLDVEPIVCECGGDTFGIRLGENVVQTKCEKCGKERLLADNDERRRNARLSDLVCRICSNRVYNTRVGYRRRRDGSPRWAYIGVRCTKCKALGSPLDWKIDPSEESERGV